MKPLNLPPSVADREFLSEGWASPPDEPTFGNGAGQRPPASLLRNSVAMMSPVVLAYLLSFIAAPIVVAGLGIRAFGIWALTGALAQYGGLLDLGVGRSLARFVAAHQNDRRACGEYIVVGLLTTAFVGSVLLAAAAISAPALAGALGRISDANMRIVLGSSVLLLACTMLTSVIAAYPVGMRRMVAPNIGVAAGALVNFIASVGAIAAGAGLPGYALANAAAGVVSVVIVSGLVLGAEGRFPISRPRRGRMREFLSYSVKTQLAWAMELINYQSDKIVIAISIGPATAGSYELANRVAAAARVIGIFPSTALLPTLTADLARHGMDYLRGAYERLTAIIVSASFPLIWLVAALAPLLLTAWLGRVPVHADAVLPALCIAYLAGVSSDVAKVVASAAGDPSPVARTAVGTAAVNLVVTVALAPIFGLWGVLAGTVVALTGGALIQVRLVHRRFSLPRRAYARAVLPTLRPCVLLAAPVFAIAYSHIIHGRLASAVAVVLLSVAYMVIYALLALRAGRVPQRLVARVPRRWRITAAA